MRICVIALYYARNLGDAVIGDCVKAGLKRYFPDADIEIRDLYGKKEFEKRKSLAMTIVRKRKRRELLRFTASRWTPLDKVRDHEIYMIHEIGDLLQEILDEHWDAAVFAGGQIFTDTLAMEVAYLTKGFGAKHVPVYFNACGTGTAQSAYITKKITKALSSSWVRQITVRDHPDFTKKYYGINSTQVWDQGLWASEVYGIKKASEAKNELEKDMSNKPAEKPIGLGMMYPYHLSEQKTKRFWIRMIRFLDQNQIPWKVFENGAEMDVAFAQDILKEAEKYSAHARDALLTPPDSPKELVQQISEFRGIISFRLHSHIIAASLDIPAVAVVWDDKVREFYELCGLQNRCFHIADRPDQIWNAYLEAEAEGWPVDRIRRGREETLRNLAQRMQEDQLKISGRFRR